MLKHTLLLFVCVFLFCSQNKAHVATDVLIVRLHRLLQNVCSLCPQLPAPPYLLRTGADIIQGSIAVARTDWRSGYHTDIPVQALGCDISHESTIALS